MTQQDATFLKMALAEAWKSAGHTRPNPPVGAVVVRNGEVIGRGRHRRCGGDHAEVAAIKDALRHLTSIRPLKALTPLRPLVPLMALRPLAGATVYVTLEPCSRPGRVGACTDALIAAGVARVVWAEPDPNPVNRGRAARVLAKAGIVGERFRGRIDLAEDWPCGRDVAALIAPFAKHVATGRPYVTVKLAMSLDGRICDDRGCASWISSPAARRRTGRLREIVDAVMVGAETVRRDNPSLLCHTRRNDDLWRVVISRSGRLPRRAQIFTDAAKDRTLVFPDPRTALEELGRRGFLHVLCEGGLNLARSLAEAGLVDEWITVLAPVVIGSRPITRAIRYSSPDAFVRVRTDLHRKK